MVIRITWGKLRAGAWTEFERTYRANVIDRNAVKGLRGRLLVQDSADKDTGFAMSLWDNLADLESYEQSAVFKEFAALLQPFFVGEYKTYRCEVNYTDMPF
jgi:heme-degrading monooxygenase HmoA